MLLAVEKAKISPQSPKTKFRLQFKSCDISIDREFYLNQE
jgi:hypothetical protein